MNQIAKRSEDPQLIASRSALSSRLKQVRLTRFLRFGVAGLLGVLALPAALAMTFADLSHEAFTRSQHPWQTLHPEPIEVIDPPEGDGPLGLDFVEYGKLIARPFYDDRVWWLRASPRGNFEKDPLEIWLYQPERHDYEAIRYRATDFPYRHPAIRPPLPDSIPDGARYLSAVDIGFQRGNSGGWPQIVHLGGNGYVRLTGFPPLGFGTSFRWGVRNVGQPNEDFVKLRKLYLQKLNDRTLRLLGLVDGQAYTAAFVATLQPGDASSLRVTMKIFLRHALRIAQEPSLGPLGLSSMFWKDENATRHDSHDEAHDADLFIAWYPDGQRREQPITIPDDPDDSRRVADFGAASDFALIQADRSPAHYQRYEVAGYANRTSLLISDIQSSLPYTVRLWQSYTDYEGADNIAVFVRFDQDAEPPVSAEDGITFSYTLTAYR